MKIWGFTVYVAASLFLIPYAGWSGEVRTIEEEELRDKLLGYWLGQLVGNYMGFPFENLYLEDPIPIDIERYYDFQDAEKFQLKMNLNDRRAYPRIMADALGGAWSDDDTDIEFVTLHAIETYGLDLTYDEVTLMWEKHINRFIWSAAREARDLMDAGFKPPQTGSRQHNDYWYRITSQLMNEIWGAIYPGLTRKAAERSEWGARIMTDSWATHPDIVYGVMYSAAFFEDDPEKLVRLSLNYIPAKSPFRRGMEDLLQWRQTEKDWRTVRKRMHEKYAAEIDGFTIPYQMGGAVINGLASILAILYGEGDFVKTVAIAISAGYDCDNQAATCGGLLGIMHGGSTIPDFLTNELPSRNPWNRPFNNQYINYSRDGLPNYNEIDDIVDRLLAISEQAIFESGGRKLASADHTLYEIPVEF